MQPTITTTAAPQSYTVQPGDTLGMIAKRYGVSNSDITGYKSGDPNKIYSGENLSISKSSAPAASPPVNSIDAANLSSTPYTPPPAPTPGAAPSGLLGLVRSTQDSITALQPTVDQGQKDITDTTNKIAGEETNRQNLYESTGVNADQKEINNLNNQMRGLDAAYNNSVDSIRGNNPTGQLESGQQYQIDQLTKDHSVTMANLAIVLQAKQGNYAMAKDIVDKKIDAETSDLKTKLTSLQYFYEKNYTQLSDSQKTLIEEQTKAVDQQLQDKKDLLSKVGDIQLEAAKNGAPASVIATIGKQSDVSTAVSTAGKYIGLYDRMNTESTIANRNKTTQLLGVNGLGGGNFTKSEIDKGAASAGVSIATFQGFDPDTKNYYVHGNIDATKKTIDAAFKAGKTADEISQTLSEMNLPPQVFQTLNTYATKSSDAYAVQTPQQVQTTIESSLKDLQTSGYTRDEAMQAVKDTLTNGGKSALPQAQTDAMNKAITNVYGKTTGQKVWDYILKAFPNVGGRK